MIYRVEMKHLMQCSKHGIWMGLIAIVMLLGAVPVYAGVDMLQQDDNVYVSDLSFTGGDHYWNVNRNSIPSICKRRNASLLQGYEYGYSYFHTIFANVSLAYRKCGQINLRARINRQTGRLSRPAQTILGGRTTGIGDIELGVRTRLNHRNTAAWEAVMIIPTGYDNTNPSRLGRGAFGLGVGLLFSSYDRGFNATSWAWKLGSRYTYFFSGKGNTLRSFLSVQYAFTDTDFVRVGDFLTGRLIHNVGFARSGVSHAVFGTFLNAVPTSLTNTDRLKFQLKYSHSFANGWSTSLRAGKSVFGRNTPEDYTLGWGLSYRWRE